MERTIAVAEAFDRSWSAMLASPGWWPAAPQAACARLRREAGDPIRIVNSLEFVAPLGQSLRQWRAFRGARFDQGLLRDSLQAVARLLPRWERETVLTLRTKRRGELFELFNAVGAVKPTKRKWVATSKLLHHLLPDLVVPMDNQLTAPFLGRGALPATFDASFLAEAYSAFVDLAIHPTHGIGAGRIREAGREVPYPVAGFVREDCRIGLARVVDFAIAGFVREQGGAVLRRL
jgi:hypothetical protein